MNRSTDFPEQYELLDHFIYQKNNNNYKTTIFALSLSLYIYIYIYIVCLIAELLR